jgi:secreted trypsin-like serine protease
MWPPFRTVLVLLVLAFSQATRGSLRIISGAPASPGQFPWQVAVQITIGNSVEICGGSIIAPDFVLTAGHCMKDLANGNKLQNPSNIVVRPGISRISGTSNDRSVARFWVEPSYDTATSQSNRIDLAIIQIGNSFSLTSAVAVIPMCQSSDNCGTVGSPLIVSGYGETMSDQGSSVSDTLNFATVTAVDQTLCSAKFDTNFGCTNCLPVTNVCAESSPVTANPGKDSCFGDSGGPLARDFGGGVSGFKLWGVVSSGTVPAGQNPSCGKVGEYGVYVSVPKNLAWINSVLSGQQNSTAIDSACVAAGTCASFKPPASGWVFPPFAWQWYYILAICVGGALVALIIILCCCCCKKR